MIMTEGALAGRHILVLNPVEVSEHFRFMDLPAELRQMVYEVMLEEDGPIKLSSHKPVHQAKRVVGESFRLRDSHKDLKWDNTTGKWFGKKPSYHSVLRVNKQVHEEAVPVAYGSNRFGVADMAVLKIFLNAIGDMCKHVKHLEIYDTSYTVTRSNSCFRALRGAVALRSITFQHQALCSKRYGWMMETMTMLPRIASDSCTMLRALREAQEDDEGATNVLDIVKVKPKGELCHRCEQQQPEACTKNYNCATHCNELEGHNTKVAAELRRCIAKDLGIEE